MSRDEELAWAEHVGEVIWGELKVIPTAKVSVAPVKRRRRTDVDVTIAIEGRESVLSVTSPTVTDAQLRWMAQLTVRSVPRDDSFGLNN